MNWSSGKETEAYTTGNIHYTKGKLFAKTTNIDQITDEKIKLVCITSANGGAKVAPTGNAMTIVFEPKCGAATAVVATPQSNVPTDAWADG